MNLKVLKSPICIVLTYSVLFLSLENVSAGQPSITVDSSGENRTKKLASKLVFISDDDPACEVKYFDVSTKRITKIVTPDACPNKMFVSSEQSSVLLIMGDIIQEITVSNEVIIKPAIQLPILKIEPGNSKGEPYNAGYYSDKSLVVAMISYYPWDDSDIYLYLYKNGNWMLKEEKHCGRFDQCEFDTLHQQGDKSHFSGDELKIWHDKQKTNPYIIGSDSRRVQEGEYEVTTTDLIFSFGDKQSILSYKIIPGPDTGVPLTMGVSLKTHGKDTVIISDEQCETSLMGTSLLLHRFWHKGTELIDISNGESVLGRLKYAEWMY